MFDHTENKSIYRKLSLINKVEDKTKLRKISINESNTHMRYSCKPKINRLINQYIKDQKAQQTYHKKETNFWSRYIKQSNVSENNKIN